MVHKYFVIYLLIINVVALIAYAVDKFKAQHNRWRIPEATLIIMAFLGGALGAFLGMYLFRHKTKHWKFRILVPLALVLWIAAVVFLYMNIL